jgi:hypothetical protein
MAYTLEEEEEEEEVFSIFWLIPGSLYLGLNYGNIYIYICRVL